MESSHSEFFFLQSKEAQNFIQNALEISPGSNYPYHNYIAFNFKNDELYNAKVYFSFFRRLEINEVQSLLPVTHDFEALYPIWTEEPERHLNHTGCAFAIKLKLDLTPTYQFHFRFPYNKRLEKPKYIHLDNEDLGVYQGLSYEYTKAEREEKRYYYLRNSQSVQVILNKFQEPFRGQIIEYTETDKLSKIIHWFESMKLSRQYFKDYAGPNMNALIDHMYEKHQCIPLYPGVYEDKSMRSVYFFKPNSNQDYVFHDHKNKHLDTVRSVLVPQFRTE